MYIENNCDIIACMFVKLPLTVEGNLVLAEFKEKEWIEKLL